LFTDAVSLAGRFGVTLGQTTIPERIAYAREPSKLPVVLSADRSSSTTRLN